MRICPDSEKHVPEKHDYCPHCGTPVEDHPTASELQNTSNSDKETDERVSVSSGSSPFVIMILVVVGGAIIFSIQARRNVDRKVSQTVETDYQYATATVNIRNGPGTNHSVDGQLQRRESVRIAIDSSTDDWVALFEVGADTVSGYVSKQYLSQTRPERKDWVQITRHNFEGQWPVTVRDGEVGCTVTEEPDFDGGTQYVNVPLFRANGEIFALTGQGEAMGYNDIRPIWRNSPGPTPKIPLSDLENRARRLCP